MAIAARAYRPFDAAYADKCLRAARQAWNWLEKYPDVMFRNPPGVSTGEYGDGNCADEHLWAAAELCAHHRRRNLRTLFSGALRRIPQDE